jgi:uncharacterized protein (DUF1697 family)
MPRYVAFLRAVNVGGRIVKMDALRGYFEDAGFTGVATFIASGNVVFDATAKAGPALETRIESTLRQALGYDVPTFVRSVAATAVAAERTVFADKDVSAAGALLVGFLKGPLDAAAEKRLAALNSDLHRFKAVGAELYWLLQMKQGESKLTPGQIERALGGPTTMRSIVSLRKLVAKHCTA